MSDEMDERPGVHLERLALAGRELRKCRSARAILDAAPRLMCSVTEAKGCTILALRAAEAAVVAHHGRASSPPRPTIDAAVRRAADQDATGRTQVTLLEGERGSSLAVTPLAAGEERWALVVAFPEGPRPDGELHAIEVLSALVEVCLAGTQASEPEGARSERTPSGRRARITFDDLLGEEPTFRACVATACRAAARDVPLLIIGETGTGKEMMAQAIHNASGRATEPFVGINMAAIPRDLLESELFGYERGAFTGARTGGKQGYFELVGCGTLLLDEIGDMPLDLQAKLLRVLQERVFTRVGGTQEVPFRARIIATTHRDLHRAAEDGHFRLDLYYRLRGVHVRLPSLRDRRPDIPLLIDACLRRFTARHGGSKVEIAPRVLEAYMEHSWPGNVRELVGLIEAEASLLPPGDTVIRRLPSIPLRIARPPDTSDAAPSSRVGRATPSPAAPTPTPPAGAISSLLEETERREYERALARFDGNVSKASRALGVSRGTLYNKIRRYGIEVPEKS
jgi:transcriptional regulator with PAS, ATPase and Fis domain